MAGLCNNFDHLYVCDSYNTTGYRCSEEENQAESIYCRPYCIWKLFTSSGLRLVGIMDISNIFFVNCNSLADNLYRFVEKMKKNEQRDEV